MLTPYQFASNRPIDGIDLDGLERIHYLYSSENTVEGQPVFTILGKEDTRKITIKTIASIFGDFGDITLESKFDKEVVIWIQSDNGVNGGPGYRFSNLTEASNAVKSNFEGINKYDPESTVTGENIWLNDFNKSSDGIGNLGAAFANFNIQRGLKNLESGPKSYLNKALSRQGLNKAGGGLKESWIEGGYKYEVRVHGADAKYGKSGDIYRVGRSKQGVDANGQGYGWEYIDSQGNWHHTSTLKPGKGGDLNPNYNSRAAQDTHISVPEN